LNQFNREHLSGSGMSNAEKAAEGTLQSPDADAAGSGQATHAYHVNTDHPNTDHPVENAPRLLTGPARWLALIGAAGCLLLAILGIVLPGLPTTPFLLLASYLLLQTSPRLHQKLTASRLFGPMIQSWEKNRAVSLRTKMWALTVVICSMIYTLIAVPMPMPVKVVIGVLGGTGITVISRLRVTSAVRDQ
jgi:uncharacterized membrane protein YbaN (DUF454 family)